MYWSGDGKAASNNGTLHNTLEGSDCVFKPLHKRKVQELDSNGERLRDCWRTPRSLFESLHAVFHFTVDACASASNALLPYYWTRQDDCLTQDWSNHVVFCNPPFSKQKLFPAKAITAKQAVVFLFHTGLFTRFTAKNPPSAIVLPPGRIPFLPPKGINEKSNPPFGVAICVYGSVTSEQRKCLATIGLVLDSQQGKGTAMATHMTEKDLARANLKVSDDGTALVPVKAVDDLAVIIKPPTVAVMPGTENAVVRPADPGADWSLNDLADYARQRLTSIPVSIFQAGRALRLARDQFKKARAWGKWLKQQGIPRTSAWEAIELLEQAKTEDALVGLTRGQALKKFGVRRKGEVTSGGGNAAGNASRKPPKPPASSSAGEGPPAKEATVLRFLAQIHDTLAMGYPDKDKIDWPKEDLAACKNMAWKIMEACEEWINEVDNHDLRKAS